MYTGNRKIKSSSEWNVHNHKIPKSVETCSLHVPIFSPKHQHSWRPILLVHWSQCRPCILTGIHYAKMQFWRRKNLFTISFIYIYPGNNIAGICWDDLCNRGHGLHSRSRNLPQGSQEPPLQSPPLLRAAPLRRLRDAGSRLHPTVELSPGDPRLILRRAWGMRLPDH